MSRKARGILWLISLGLALQATASPMATDQLKGELERRALLYFVENAHPQTGLVLDRAPNFSPGPRPNYRIASIAATGFGMAALANAAKRGLLPAAFVRARIRRTLDFALHHLYQHAGWLYHFVDWERGERIGLSEVSTIDTALFLAGALYAASVFPGGEIASDARALYERADFVDMMTNGGQLPRKLTLAMGWLPESGYLPWDWDHYSELMILVLLGLGSPTHPLPPPAWTAWKRDAVTIAWDKTLLGGDLPLFAHQYSQLFVDFRHRSDQFANYFLNSVLATTRDRATCALDNAFATFRQGFWGLSASDSPAGYYPFSPLIRRGTICPACAGASVMFLPQLVLGDLLRWRLSQWQSSLWGRYGFVDSLNLDASWFDHDVLGITVGPLYLSLANTDDSTAIWTDFDRLPEIQTALAKAGFR